MAGGWQQVITADAPAYWRRYGPTGEMEVSLTPPSAQGLDLDALRYGGLTQSRLVAEGNIVNTGFNPAIGQWEDLYRLPGTESPLYLGSQLPDKSEFELSVADPNQKGGGGWISQHGGELLTAVGAALVGGAALWAPGALGGAVVPVTSSIAPGLADAVTATQTSVIANSTAVSLADEISASIGWGAAGSTAATVPALSLADEISGSIGWGSGAAPGVGASALVDKVVTAAKGIAGGVGKSALGTAIGAAGKALVDAIAPPPAQNVAPSIGVPVPFNTRPLLTIAAVLGVGVLAIHSMKG